MTSYEEALRLLKNARGDSQERSGQDPGDTMMEPAAAPPPPHSDYGVAGGAAWQQPAAAPSMQQLPAGVDLQSRLHSTVPAAPAQGVHMHEAGTTHFPQQPGVAGAAANYSAGGGPAVHGYGAQQQQEGASAMQGGNRFAPAAPFDEDFLSQEEQEAMFMYQQRLMQRQQQQQPQAAQSGMHHHAQQQQAQQQQAQRQQVQQQQAQQQQAQRQQAQDQRAGTPPWQHDLQQQLQQEQQLQQWRQQQMSHMGNVGPPAGSFAGGAAQQPQDMSLAALQQQRRAQARAQQQQQAQYAAAQQPQQQEQQQQLLLDGQYAPGAQANGHPAMLQPVQTGPPMPMQHMQQARQQQQHAASAPPRGVQPAQQPQQVDLTGDSSDDSMPLGARKRRMPASFMADPSGKRMLPPPISTGQPPPPYAAQAQGFTSAPGAGARQLSAGSTFQLAGPSRAAGQHAVPGLAANAAAAGDWEAYIRRLMEKGAQMQQHAAAVKHRLATRTMAVRSTNSTRPMLPDEAAKLTAALSQMEVMYRQLNVQLREAHLHLAAARAGTQPGAGHAVWQPQIGVRGMLVPGGRGAPSAIGRVGGGSKGIQPSPAKEKENKMSDHQAALRAVVESLQVTGHEELEPPPKTLAVSILLHQRMALAWMVRRETGDGPRGGILADDQGLGKTVTTISLILTHHPDESNANQRTSTSGDAAAAAGTGAAAAAADGSAAGTSTAGAAGPCNDESGGSRGTTPALGGGGSIAGGGSTTSLAGLMGQEAEGGGGGGADAEDVAGHMGALQAERDALDAALADDDAAAAADMVANEHVQAGAGGGGGGDFNMDDAPAFDMETFSMLGLLTEDDFLPAPGPDGDDGDASAELMGAGFDPHAYGNIVQQQQGGALDGVYGEGAPLQGMAAASGQEPYYNGDGSQPGCSSWGAAAVAAAPQVKEEEAGAAQAQPPPGAFGFPPRMGDGTSPLPGGCSYEVKPEPGATPHSWPAGGGAHAAEQQPSASLAQGPVLDLTAPQPPHASTPGVSGGGGGAHTLPTGLPRPPSSSCVIDLLDDSPASQQQQYADGGGGAAAPSAARRTDDDDGILEVCEVPAPAAGAAPATAGDLAGPKQVRLPPEPEPPNLLPGGTLVVCPTSVLHQWAREIRDKVLPIAHLQLHVYHGKDKLGSAKQLAAQAVVLTTYGTLAQEAPTRDKASVKLGKQGTSSAPIDLLDEEEEAAGGAGVKVEEGKGKGPARGKAKVVAAEGGTLYLIKWQRVVLDEAQSIKNPRTLAAHAAWRLYAHCRWCLSGTPIQNGIDDLYSYFKFLRYAPYSDSRAFKQLIKDKIAEKPEVGYKFLQAVLQAVLLRRTKQSTINGEPIIKLPGREQTLCQQTFSTQEQAFYAKVQSDSMRSLREAMAAGGPGGQQYVNMLHLLLRLRQACNHPWLVQGGRKWHKSGTPSSQELEAARKLDAATLAQLRGVINGPLAQCPCCGDVAEDPMASTCGHVFCRQCAATQREGAGVEGEFLCPSCNRNLRAADLHSAAALAGAAGEQPGGAAGDAASAAAAEEAWVSSAKVDKLMALLEEVRAKNKAAAAAKPAHQPSTVLATKSRSDAKMAGALRRLPPIPTAGASTSAGGSGGGSDGGASGVMFKPDKVIVFSQWTSMLDLLEIPLKKAKLHFRRLDGTMTVAARERAIGDFESKPDVLVLLVSLKAAALGVNLTVANHVVLMDLWWNPSIEEQAIDRAHRIGQTRTVHVSRITVAGSVEDKILELQQRKREIIASTLAEGRDGSAAAGRLTMDDLRFLFQGLA